MDKLDLPGKNIVMIFALISIALIWICFIFYPPSPYLLWTGIGIWYAILAYALGYVTYTRQWRRHWQLMLLIIVLAVGCTLLAISVLRDINS